MVDFNVNAKVVTNAAHFRLECSLLLPWYSIIEHVEQSNRILSNPAYTVTKQHDEGAFKH